MMWVKDIFSVLHTHNFFVPHHIILKREVVGIFILDYFYLSSSTLYKLQKTYFLLNKSRGS